MAYDLVTMLNEEEVDIFKLVSILEIINQMKEKFLNNKTWFYKYLQAKSSNISTKVQDFIHKRQLALVNDIHMDALMQIKNLELLELLDEYGILKSLILFMNKNQIENIIDFLNYLKNHKQDMVKYQENLHYLLENFRYFNLLPNENLDIDLDCIVTGSEGEGIISDGHFEFDYCPENEDAYYYSLSQPKIVIYYALSKNQVIDKRVTVNDLEFDTSYVPKNANEFFK